MVQIFLYNYLNAGVILESLDAMLKEQEVQADEQKEDVPIEDTSKESGDSNE